MSVIIKGMEMPKNCYDCPLHDGEIGRCNILGTTVCDYIPKECPLVEMVQCKNCKYWKYEKAINQSMCKNGIPSHDPNGFCHHAKLIE